MWIPHLENTFDLDFQISKRMGTNILCLFLGTNYIISLNPPNPGEIEGIIPILEIRKATQKD